MDSESLQKIAFEIILNSGDAKNIAYEAIAAMKENNFDEARLKLGAVNEALVTAHKTQTMLLNHFASGEKIEIDILMVHAQDHLMTTMTFRDMAVEMLEIYQRLNEK